MGLLQCLFLLLLFVRLYIPHLTESYPALEEFHGQIMMFAAIQTSIMFGFIVSFLLLEEKDAMSIQSLRVLPISSYYFIGYRLFFAALFSFLTALMTIQFAGIAYPGFKNAILLSLQYALAAPLIVLIVATYAKNKVEGMAYFKCVDLLFMLPLRLTLSRAL